MKVDIFREMELPTPISGIVYKVTSPKGIRWFDEDSHPHYTLHREIAQVYQDGPKKIELSNGLYWVLDIHKEVYEYIDPDDKLQRLHSRTEIIWDHYLIIIIDNTATYYRGWKNQTDSSWVKKAIPYIKEYFNKSVKSQ